MKLELNPKLLVAVALLVGVLVAAGVVLWMVVLGPDSGDTTPVATIGEPVSIALPAQKSTNVTHESGARILRSRWRHQPANHRVGHRSRGPRERT